MKNKSLIINASFFVIAAAFATAFGYFQIRGDDLKHDPIVFWITLTGGIVGLLSAAISLFWTFRFIYLALKKCLSLSVFIVLIALDLVKYAVLVLALINNNLAYNVLWPLLTAIEVVFYAQRVKSAP
ncbi:hypothetical protein [Asticcacaulis sp.]|uniref:hypothetical protein n=1 Tax=Asticcacaulis sp. TaxID=1872648 RepID=UPI003F7CA9C0